MSRLEHFQRYLDKKPGDRFAMYGLALELKKAGREDDALAAFEDLLARHPHSGAGHYQLGLLHEEVGREAEAIEAWRRGLAALQGVDDPEARRSIDEIRAALASLEG